MRARPVLGWLLALNLAVGLALSPATATRRVRVLGAKPADQARMRAVLEGLRGVPYFLVRGPEVESRLAAAPHLDSVSVSRNLFGRAVVRVFYRRPVARIASQRSLALDPHGVAFLSPEPVRGVPTVFLPGQAFRPWLSVCAPFETRSVAWVCERATAIPNLDLGSVVLTYQGAVSLRDRSGATVVLGPAERLGEKLERLEAVLAERPSLFESVLELNLTAPSRPAIVERPGVVQP